MSSSPATAPRRLRVLLAEDHPVNQKIGHVKLSRAGHDVTIAADGLTAVTAFQTQPFDVILMDVQMPEMDGHEAARAIRAHEAVHGGHVLIIALTAHAMQTEIDRCLAAGMDAYIGKPVDWPALESIMQSRFALLTSTSVAGAPAAAR